MAVLLALRLVETGGEDASAVVAKVVAKPQPVLAGDGRRHLAYELLVTNVVRSTATLDSVKTLARGKVIASLSGDRLAGTTIPFGADEPGRVLEPGRSGYILMDPSLPLKAKVPRRLVHRFTVSLVPPSSVNAKTYRTAPTRVATREPPVLAPPLRGKRWVIGNGCCDDLTSHRLALLGVDGALYDSERFAIDFFQLRSNGLIADGPLNVLSNYPFFGAKVYSATRGRVVRAVKNLPETQPDPTSTSRRPRLRPAAATTSWSGCLTAASPSTPISSGQHEGQGRRPGEAGAGARPARQLRQLELPPPPLPRDGRPQTGSFGWSPLPLQAVQGRGSPE